MSEERSLQVSGTIDAPPERVFALLADPAQHTELDGAGMLRGLDEGPSPVSGVGDAFVMKMNQDGIGDYRMRSEVVDFEPGRRIAWAPAIHPPGSLSHVIGELDPSGHTYGWELEPTADGGTKVTHTYDWSGVRDEGALALYPRVSQEQMSASLTRLGDALR
ncbi:SRPBCC family protein [Pseudonocardia sp.]|uniref:SRPBCC family protein n=1 Tax=Pseudonocardia sp. TaxID=60912 RepID=UPI00260D7221|nr:SRPBCC family protein [Pseudonocardia sp.]